MNMRVKQQRLSRIRHVWRVRHRFRKKRQDVPS